MFAKKASENTDTSYVIIKSVFCSTMMLVKCSNFIKACIGALYYY